MLKTLATAVSLLLIALSGAHAQDRSISKIAGDVYRFQEDFHYSVFVLTQNGVVVTDPINFHAARWLKTEIAKLTDKPITHIVYSHSHSDHASGGKAFGEVPNVIAHANAPDAVNGVAVTQRFDETQTVTAGGKTLELTYLGPGHGKDLIAMVIRPENVGFIVDAVGVKQLPYRDMSDTDVDELIAQIRKIESLDFDILAGGHGPIGTKQDATDVRIYIEELQKQVLASLNDGKSIDELIATVTMDDYKDWGWTYNWRPLNIRGMVRHLKQKGVVN